MYITSDADFGVSARPCERKKESLWAASGGQKSAGARSCAWVPVPPKTWATMPPPTPTGRAKDAAGSSRSISASVEKLMATGKGSLLEMVMGGHISTARCPVDGSKPPKRVKSGVDFVPCAGGSDSNVGSASKT